MRPAELFESRSDRVADVEAATVLFENYVMWKLFVMHESRRILECAVVGNQIRSRADLRTGRTP